MWAVMMARYRILYWYHIPSVVEASDGVDVHKEQLSARFQELIDRVAMRNKMVGSEAYLEGWRKGRPKSREGDAKTIARAIVEETEAEYENIAAKNLEVT